MGSRGFRSCATLMSVASLFVVGIVAFAAVDDGLVLYYPFEGSSDGQIEDMSGEGNHGELRGAVRTSEGIRNNAIEFPTHFDGAYIPGSPSMIVEDDDPGFTVSFWAYPIEWNVDGTAENRAVYRNRQYNVDLFQGGGRFHISQNLAWPGVNGAPEMPLEQWTLVTATWSPEDGCILYRDGLEIKVDPGTAGEIDENRGIPAWTALGFFEPHQGYIGRMDDLRIYDRPLDEDEALELFDFEPPQAVSPKDKVASMWGAVKDRR